MVSSRRDLAAAIVLAFVAARFTIQKAIMTTMITNAPTSTARVVVKESKRFINTRPILDPVKEGEEISGLSFSGRGKVVSSSASEYYFHRG
jgi:hypothetical protein